MPELRQLQALHVRLPSTSQDFESRKPRPKTTGGIPRNQTRLERRGKGQKGIENSDQRRDANRGSKSDQSRQQHPFSRREYKTIRRHHSATSSRHHPHREAQSRRTRRSDPSGKRSHHSQSTPRPLQTRPIRPPKTFHTTRSRVLILILILDFRVHVLKHHVLQLHHQRSRHRIRVQSMRSVRV